MGGYMGIPLLITGGRNIKMMKTFAIALLAAVAIAEPEAKPKADADPYLLYGGYGYGLGHLGYSGYYGYPYAHGYIGKRSADAEPEAKADADPYLLYGGYGLGHLGYRGYYGYPYAHSYAYYGKRSADADPYLLYGGYGYGHLGYRGYYGYPHGGYAYFGQVIITKALSCYRKWTKQPSMSSSSVTTFSVLEFLSRKQRESKYKEINNELQYVLH